MFEQHRHLQPAHRGTGRILEIRDERDRLCSCLSIIPRRSHLGNIAPLKRRHSSPTHALAPSSPSRHRLTVAVRPLKVDLGDALHGSELIEEPFLNGKIPLVRASAMKHVDQLYGSTEPHVNIVRGPLKFEYGCLFPLVQQNTS